MAFPYTIDLEGNGGAFRFRTVEELNAFLDAEAKAWKWVPGHLKSLLNVSNALQGLSEKVSGHFTAIQSIRTQLTQQNLEAAQALFAKHFRASTSLPTSISTRGALIEQVRRDFGESAAMGALATLMKLRLDGNDPDQVRGIFAAHEFVQGTGKTARQGVQSAMAALLQRLSSQQLRAEDKADALDRRIEELERRRRQQFQKLLRAGGKARQQFAANTEQELQRIGAASTEAIGRIGGSAQDAVASILSTEQVYKEHMALQGPVTYWRDKAKKHTKNATVARIVGLTYATAIVIYAFLDGAWRILALVKDAVAETKQWQVAYVVLTVAVFLLTVAFWIGRLISRTYVSEAHLAIDAEERATMVQTYLALANEGKISDAERILVLGSLFRPSSDGLVRDDAAPDLSFAGLASKLGAGPSQPGR